MANLLPSVGIALAAAGATFLLTGLVRRWVLRRAILDHPNERSSHTTPTPRGGGIAVASVVLLCLIAAGFRAALPWNTVIALTGGSAIVAAVGWVDDVRSLSAHWRLACHFLAAAWAVAWLGGMPSLSLGQSSATLGLVGALLAVIGIVWATNLFNFMDGIDGIAGVEAFCVGAIGGILLFHVSAPGLAMLSFLIGGAALGFLFWNWSPARIFLGDVGSGFLGFLIAAMALASENARAVPLIAWVILASVFIVDATLTFGRRLRSGHWRDAHRTHAYQRAVQSGWSHATVTLLVGILNLLVGAVAAMTVSARLSIPLALLLTLLVVGGAYAVVERRKPFPIEKRGIAGGGA
jgi:Fuc2NAc and GlcNAc transferase